MRFQSRRRTPGADIKRCFVCKKKGCWSTKHPQSKRDCQFNQYILEQEGEEEDHPEPDDKLSDKTSSSDEEIETMTICVHESDSTSPTPTKATQ